MALAIVSYPGDACKMCGCAIVQPTGAGRPRQKCHSCRHKRAGHYVNAVHCTICQTVIPAGTYRKKYCSTSCAAAGRSKYEKTFWAAKPKVEQVQCICVACNTAFQKHPNSNKIHCSVVCQKRAHRRINDPLRRARRRSAKVERVDPLRVFARDKWHCKLCGCKTPERLRGSTDPKAPEMDHIVPLSKGGEHSYRNVQCTCRKCNGLKRAKPFGQMLLFG